MTVTLVVMGVSGVGKSTVAAELAARTGWTSAEGDEFHSAEARAKMSAGHPLEDEDRWPWLRRLAAWIGEQESAGRDAVLACSALRRSYREVLRDGHPSVRFVHLDATSEVIAGRLDARAGHYMPSSLLGSQIATLERLEAGEPGVVVDAAGGAAHIAEEALRALGIDVARRDATE